MEQLPNEILEEVLCRLAVKCILRFRCVSKSWLAVISNPYFVKLHLNRSIQTKRYLRYFRRNAKKANQKVKKVDYIPFPLTFPINCRIVASCSCDGLLCMSRCGNPQCVCLWNPSSIRNFVPAPSCLDDGLLCTLEKVRAIDNVFVWNPSTRKSIKLPYTSIEITNQFDIFNASIYCAYQIGYDNINDDYKVVRIVILLSNHILDYEIKIYSLTSNSWHTVEKFPHYPSWSPFENAIAGGAFHFTSTVKSDLKNESFIVAFDLGTEKCRILPHPEYSSPHFKLYLNNLEGCLSLSCKYESSIVDVFVLKEYGRKNEHWSKLITLLPTTTFEIYHYVTPIAYSNSGKKVWLNIDSRRLVLYNLELKSVEEIMVHGRRELTSLLYSCPESLVNVNVPTATAETEEVV